MKICYSSNSILTTVLPLFFLILGILSIRSQAVVLDINFFIKIVFASMALSYLFFRDVISVLISFGCTISTMFGILFFIDLFKVEYSTLIVSAIMISLIFSILINTLVLCSIHQNKKAFHSDAKLAVDMAVTINFWSIILSLILLLILAFIFKISLKEYTGFTIVLSIGFLMALTNTMLLLPVLSISYLGHINEEPMQDDLIPSYSEEILRKFNESIEKTGATLIWIISPIVNNRIFALSVTVLSALVIVVFISNFFGVLQIRLYLNNNHILIIALAYYFVLVIRYQSYILVFSPLLSVFLNYCVVYNMCCILLVKSPILMEVTFFCCMAITAAGAYLQTDITLHYYKNRFNVTDAILNASAKIIHPLLACVIIILFFITSFYFLSKPETFLYKEFVFAGIIIILSFLLLLFPAPAFMGFFLRIHNYTVRPRKKRIKSIYL